MRKWEELSSNEKYDLVSLYPKKSKEDEELFYSKKKGREMVYGSK